MKKRLHVFYSGSVHGVGFRYTAARIASSLSIKGWVRNVEDGRVEVVCEGNESELKEFMQKIADTFENYIRDADIEWGKKSGEFETFDIRF